MVDHRSNVDTAQSAWDRCWKQIGLHNDSVNALVQLAPRDPGDRRGGALGEMVLSAKDSIFCGDLPATGGVRWFEQPSDAVDAPPLARLRAEGCRLIGKSNLAELSAGYETVNRRYGRTLNPRWPELSCGGSSGGGAAAVALGMSQVDLATDLAGSVTLPAAFCGVSGLKLSLSACPVDGIVPGAVRSDAHGLATRFGLLAASVVDLAPPARVLLGTPEDAGPVRSLAVSSSSSEFRPEPGIEAGLESVAAMLETRGVNVVRLDLGDLVDRAALACAVLGGFETGAGSALPQNPKRFTAGGLAAAVALGRRGDQGAVDAALESSHSVADRLSELHEQHDAILAPACHLTAPPPPLVRSMAVGSNARPVEDLAAWQAIASVAGLPTVTMPFPSPLRGAGLQIIGRAEGDARTIGVGLLIEELACP